MKRLITLTIAAFSVITLSSQSMIVKQAHKLYENLAYSKAIDLYEYAVEKNVKDPMVLRNLADSYEKIRAFDKACQYYEELVLTENSVTSDYLNYAQNLKSLGKYEESRAWMTKYQESVKDDSRAEMHGLAGEYEFELLKNESQYTVEALNINSPEMDWGTSVFGNKAVFATNRTSPDLTQAEHEWNGQAFLDIYEAQISDQGNLYDLKRLESPVNTVYHEGGTSFSSDGKTMWFTRNNYFQKKVKKTSRKVVNLKMFSVIQNDNGEWSNETPFDFNSDEYSVGHPSISSDGKAIFFTSDMPGGKGGKDIWKSELDDNGKWTQPENCGDINTEGDEMFPYMAEDGTLYFSSNGHVGLGGLDIFAAIGEDQTWMVENIGSPINNYYDDFAIVLRNPSEGYFSSNRSGGQGSDDIYKFNVDPPRPSFALKGVVVNSSTKEPMEGSKVALIDSESSTVAETTSNSKGEYFFKLYENPCDHKVLIDNGSDYQRTQTIKSPCDHSKNLIVMDEVEIEKSNFVLAGIINDNVSSNPIGNMNIVVLDKEGNEVMSKATNEDGSIDLPLSENTDYDIRFEKEGYESRTIEFTTKGKEQGAIDLNEVADLKFSKVDADKTETLVEDGNSNTAVNEDSEISNANLETIEIENILFDFDKSNIRPDAALILDKIVKVMKENPQIVIELGSHTDSRGADDYNINLSARRAESSAKYIISKGIAKNRINERGYGETKLNNHCSNGVKCSEKQHQQNRRTEFKIIKF